MSNFKEFMYYLSLNNNLSLQNKVTTYGYIPGKTNLKAPGPDDKNVKPIYPRYLYFVFIDKCDRLVDIQHFGR